MPVADESASPAARVVIPDGQCITFKCDNRVFEVCAGDQASPVIRNRPVPPGGITGVTEVKGVVDLHELDVNWDDRDEVTLFHASG
jgi:hypothetical protein